MLTAIRQLGLDFLATELKAKGDFEDWYLEVRTSRPEEILSWLVESPEGAERYYVISADQKDSDLAILEVRDLKRNDFSKLPFNQGTGARSAALGPIVKRTFSAAKIGPTSGTQKTTLKSFESLGKSEQSFSPYFTEALDCFNSREVEEFSDG